MMHDTVAIEPTPRSISSADGHRHPTAAETATIHLRQWILGGFLVPGAKLNQAQLASELGMSRIPIRDAIRALADEGLVVHDPHRTATVAPLDLKDVSELYELRIALEPVACALAVPSLTIADLEAMGALLDRMSSATGDPGESLDLHDRFHATLYRRSGRERMISILDRARQQTRRYTWIRFERDADEIESEHRLILAASARGDAPSVRALVTAHLTGSHTVVSDRIRGAASGTVPPSDGRGGLADLRGGDRRED